MFANVNTFIHVFDTAYMVPEMVEVQWGPQIPIMHLYVAERYTILLEGQQIGGTEAS